MIAQSVSNFMVVPYSLLPILEKMMKLHLVGHEINSIIAVFFFKTPCILENKQLQQVGAPIYSVGEPPKTNRF